VQLLSFYFLFPISKGSSSFIVQWSVYWSIVSLLIFRIYKAKMHLSLNELHLGYNSEEALPLIETLLQQRSWHLAPSSTGCGAGPHPPWSVIQAQPILKNILSQFG
jgi:hypothetical protein